jgi:hypothetical protein
MAQKYHVAIPCDTRAEPIPINISFCATHGQTALTSIPKVPVMKHWIHSLPTLVVLTACGLLLAYGPIPLPAGYHQFADQSVFLGVPHAADVLSNLGFLLVGMWGWLRLYPSRAHPALRRGWPGYRLFLAGLMLTALGSAYYHWAPDDAHIVWDQLSIALACAGLLSALRAETGPERRGHTIWLAFFAVASVAWFAYGNRQGQGDLRPYLVVQVLPMVLGPLWQAIYRAPRRDRAALGIAILLYLCARLAEVLDHPLLALTGAISGHTLKHLLATAAAAVLVGRLVERVRPAAQALAPPAPPECRA